MNPDWEHIQFYNSVKITFFAWFTLALPLLFSLRRGCRSPLTRRNALILVILLITTGGFTTYRALSNEITGKAVYSTSKFSHEEVTRDSSPTKFRRATNMAWGWSGFCFLTAMMYARVTFRMRSQPVVKVAAEYSSEELAHFREAFAPHAAHYRTYSRRFLVIGAILAVIVFSAAYAAPTNAVVDWVCGLLVLGYLAMLGHSWRSQPLLECPACHNRLDSGACGRYCPGCGSERLRPGSWLASSTCSVCSKTMYRSKTPNMRTCTHCGVML